MKTKIPPPILALVMIVLIYLSSFFIESTTFNYQGSLIIFLSKIHFNPELSTLRYNHPNQELV